MSDPLPELITMSDCRNNWDDYLDAIYRVYLDEIVNANLTFRGLPIRVKFIPKTDGKGYGFWHLIQEGETEDDRIPDLRRCERIRWIPWMINHVDNVNILWWENQRKSSTNIVLWLRDQKFAVVLSTRNGFFLLTTAYDVRSGREKTFEKEWKNFHGKG